MQTDGEREMKRVKYEILMVWCGFWLKVWTLWSFLNIPENLDNKLFAWVVGQCGYGYLGPWSMAKDIDF